MMTCSSVAMLMKRFIFWGIVICLLASCIEAQTTSAQITSPPPLSTGGEYPCPAGDAKCFCKWKNGTLGMFADKKAGCAKYFWCTDFGPLYESCPSGLLFSDQLMVCNWPSQVSCGPPAPSPPPSPSPSPSPMDSRVPVTSSPPPSPVVQPPLPLSTGGQYPCPAGDAKCFCKWKNGTLGMFADKKAGCAKYFWCTDFGPLYESCPSGLLFSDQLMVCNWPSQVSCGPPVPSPPPSPPPPPFPPPPPIPPPPPPLPPAPPAPPGGRYQFAGYFQSWSDKWTNDANMSALANLPPYVTTVILSFMTPDTRYGGGITWSGTGLQFSSDPAVVKDEIALLKSRNPNTKVLVAVGGATYPNFANLNATAIALFVKTFGLDGVDLDFEPGNPSCSAVNGSVSCASDSLYITSVRELRKALPKGSAILTAATWSVGAYGEGQWASAPPASPYTGVALTMLKTVGSLLDSLHVMGYDAGLSYSPLQAYDAYRHYYPSGDILMGVEVPIEFGGHILTLPELDAIASYMKSQGGQGIMLFSLQKRSGTTLTAEQISQRICIDLNLEQCSCGLYCLPS